MKTRSRRFLITLAVVGGTLALLYAAAPAILANIAVRVLSGVFDVRSLEIESVGPTEIDVAAIGVNDSQMSLDAKHAVVRYRLWPFQIRGVDIEQARLTLAPAGGASVPVPAAVPAFLPFPLRIKSLDIRARTPWGEVRVPLSLESRSGPAGGLVATVHTPELSASLGNPGRNRQTLTIVDARGASLLTLDAALNGEYPVHFDASVDPGNVTKWIHTSAMIPEAIKAELAPFDIDGKEVHVKGTIARNMDFSARVLGAMVVHDKRDASTRLFQSIDFTTPSGYSIGRTGTSWSGTGAAGLEFALDPQTTFTAHNPHWTWKDSKGLTFNAAEPSLKQLGMDADEVEVTVPSLTAAGTRGTISAKGVRLSGWPKGLSHYDLDGTWSWTGTSLTAGGNGNGPGLPALSWKLQISEGQGLVEISGHDAVAALSPSLQVYTQSIARQLTVKSGDVDGRYRFQWNPKGEQTGLALTAGPVNADLDQMEIRGMEARVANQGNTIDQLTVGLSVPSLKLGAGVVAENAELKLRLALPEIHIDAASLHLFGGEISIHPASINLNDDKFEFLADVDSMSLEKIMNFFDLKSTQLTGAVTGPIRVVYAKDGGIEINEGDLHSIRPGVLKFSMGPDAAAATQLDNIALRALQDFKYKELKASLLYKPDGEYRITARIVGSNPNVLNGHLIALNPTIHGRLPALFRAFFVTGDFDRAIIETLQKKDFSSTSGETPSLNDD